MDDVPTKFNAPAAIAFSGGGDSTALMHRLSTNPSVTHALIVDHALRENSAEEVAQAAKYAQSFGYQVLTDRWAHQGIKSGIQAKARDYRYSALGRLCREIGIEHLVTAHTADDQAETLAMRLDRQTGWRGLAGMPGQAYGPLWPALAGVTLHRPWLHKSRQELRDYNVRHKLKFVDDPSNQNTDFARIRARKLLAADPDLRRDLLTQQERMRIRLSAERLFHREWLDAHARIDPQGYIVTDAVPSAELMLHILNAVSGRGGPIDAAKRVRLCRDMESPIFKAATLGGAWVLRQKSNGVPRTHNSFVFLRDRVAVTGRGATPSLLPMKLAAGVLTPWDGRFLCQAKLDGVRVELASGHLQNFRQDPDFKPLFDLPKEVRESLPIFFYRGTAVSFGACDTKYLICNPTSASRLQALSGSSHPVPI